MGVVEGLEYGYQPLWNRVPRNCIPQLGLVSEDVTVGKRNPFGRHERHRGTKLRSRV